MQVYFYAVLREALFTPEEPNFESQYWSSMSTILTYLNLTLLEKNITEETSAVLCQLTRLESLELYEGTADVPEVQVFSGLFSLDLPLLEYLGIEWFGLRSLHLNCPMLDEVNLHAVGVKSFYGMPSSVWTVSLDLTSGSMPLQEIVPPHSAESLETLYVSGHSQPCTDPEAVKELCVNGKLTYLTMDDITFHAGAFSVCATWRAVPETLQHVTLEVLLNEGIPRILEQLRGLRALSLTHSGNSRMHLDRPLGPFLDMPRLENLELQSSWNEDMMGGAGMCMWTPKGLRMLGLAEKRIRHMQMRRPGRSITLDSLGRHHAEAVEGRGLVQSPNLYGLFRRLASQSDLYGGMRAQGPAKHSPEDSKQSTADGSLAIQRCV